MFHGSFWFNSKCQQNDVLGDSAIVTGGMQTHMENVDFVPFPKPIKSLKKVFKMN